MSRISRKRTLRSRALRLIRRESGQRAARETKKKPENIIGRRIIFLLIFFCIAIASLIARLFVLQVVNYRRYTELAAKQHRVVEEVTPERGSVSAQDKNHNPIPLALNRTYYTVAAIPLQVTEPDKTAALLAQLLNVPPEPLLERLSKQDDPYEILIKKLDEEKKDLVKKERIDGIVFEEEKGRVYPYKALGAHILGFVSKETEYEVGRYGLEKFYEKDLAGEKGIWEGARDAGGFWIALGKRIIHPSKNGSDLTLTIDYNIQAKAEQILAETREKWQAVSGSLLITDPMTGHIIALAGQPTFDPNEFAKEKDFAVFLNPSTERSYELGSVMKPITMAAGIEEKIVSPQSTYTDPGIVRIGGYTVKNFDEGTYGVQTMTQVLEKSLNTGMVHVAKLLGHERELAYLKKFGFGEKTGIDLPGEISGNISNLEAGREIDFMTASFGQGIAVTPLQLAMAIGAIANGGNLMTPQIVERVVDDSGNERIIEPVVKRQVISKSTSETITKMLISVVNSGFENKAGVKGYFVAGKTGTAQIPNRTGRGYSDNIIHTFVGYAPAFKPRFLVIFQLNEPIGNRFASNTLTPAFHDLAEYILNYYEVPPDEKQ